MTPIKTAIHLVEKFAEIVPEKRFGVLMERDWDTAKKCALACVEEIINIEGNYLIDKSDWREVKNKIEAL